MTARPVGDDSRDDHAYFRQIEETFIRLRGSPLLLSPSDWQVARRWRRQGVPPRVIREALEELFGRRKERGSRGKISSLRYCAPAVEAAWQEDQRLTAAARGAVPERMRLEERLRSLASALPVEWPPAARAAAAIEALAGEPGVVEERLKELDRMLIGAARREIDPAELVRIGQQVEERLRPLAQRLPEEEVKAARARLTDRALRDRLGLPLLSLFAPQAVDGSKGA